MMRYLILVGAAALLAACAVLSPEQQQTAIQTINAMLTAGTITPTQAQALTEAITTGGAVPIGEQAITALVGAVLGYAGTRIHRGPPTKGKAA